MKKILSTFSIMLAFLACISLMAFELQQNGNGKGNSKGNQKEAKGKPAKEDKGNRGQGNQGNGNGNNGNGKGNGNGNSDNNGNNGNGNGNKGRGNNNRNGNDVLVVNDKPGNGNGRKARINLPGNNWYSWTDQNYRNRSQFRNKGKVTICHKFNSGEPVTITVSENALKAHLGHGDVAGSCPAVNNSIFSDIFRKRRADYYNDLYYSQDQYNYSSSILDYALMRLTNSRMQLDQMRLNNAPQADIERREAAVMGLEQNVSLLETALGIAGELLVSRL